MKNAKVFIIIVCLCSLHIPAAQAREGWFSAIGNSEAERIFLRARAAYADGAWERARQPLERLRDKEGPFRIEVLLMLERVYTSLGNKEKARECLIECTRLCRKGENIKVEMIRRLSEVPSMIGHTLSLARKHLNRHPEALAKLAEFLDGMLYCPLAVLVTAVNIEEEPTTSESFEERWQILQRMLLAAPRHIRNKHLPAYSKLVQIKLGFFKEPMIAAKKLDDQYAKVRQFIEEHLYSPLRHRAPAPSENPFFPYVLVSLPNIEQLIKEVEEKPTDGIVFLRRWNVLQSYIKKVPAKERRNELFAYSRLVQVKLLAYSQPEKAYEQLDELVRKVCKYLALR